MQRALLLYQTGSRLEALLELEAEEAVLRGYPEVHAALAVLLHAERPQQLGRVEGQWETCMEFDRRYEDAAWVRETKHWPPAVCAALERFLRLD